MPHLVSITVLPRSATSGPLRYSARIGDEVIVQASKDPETDVCRVLHAKGLRGPLLTIVGGKPSLRIDIERGAKLRARDSVNSGPRFYKWQPFERDAA